MAPANQSATSFPIVTLEPFTDRYLLPSLSHSRQIPPLNWICQYSHSSILVSSVILCHHSELLILLKLLSTTRPSPMASSLLSLKQVLLHSPGSDVFGMHSPAIEMKISMKCSKSLMHLSSTSPSEHCFLNSPQLGLPNFQWRGSPSLCSDLHSLKRQEIVNSQDCQCPEGT